jgi:hypothetical protein
MGRIAYLSERGNMWWFRRRHPLPLAPLRNSLLVDPVALGQRPQALLTMLYRSTDCLCRGGAPVQNLSHSASLHAGENNAPANSGIKHLGRVRGGALRQAGRLGGL